MFLYWGTVGAPPETICEVSAIADKYQVLELKNLCLTLVQDWSSDPAMSSGVVVCVEGFLGFATCAVQFLRAHEFVDVCGCVWDIGYHSGEIPFLSRTLI